MTFLKLLRLAGSAELLWLACRTSVAS